MKIEIKRDQRTLLVIDDNQGIVELLNRFLATYNFQVISASSGVVGIDLSRNNLPDVIILDVMMPDMDGWEVLQRLQSYPETEHIPIVVCSVLADDELAYSLGASSTIAKPVTEENIVGALKKLHII